MERAARRNLPRPKSLFLFALLVLVFVGACSPRPEGADDGAPVPSIADAAATDEHLGSPPALILISLDGFRWD